MIEIMVAIFVLSIGLLGLASLQTLSVRNNTSAYHRTIATQMAYDMADRMRANSAGVASNEYNSPTATQNANCLTITGCTPAQMADHDMFEWSTELANALPSGSGIVCQDDDANVASSALPDCDGGTRHAIKVWWVDDRSGNEMGLALPVTM